MRKIFILIFTLFSFLSQAQITISALPATTDPNSGYLPIVRGGYNYKLLTDSLFFKKIDSIKISNDTLYYYKYGGVRYTAGVFSGGGGSTVPNSRTITINGTTYDLSSNRSWTVGDVLTSGSYSNPSWITSLAWSKLTGTPTTLSGYGITNAEGTITAPYTTSKYWNGYKSFVSLNTDSVTEGSSNLFWTNSRFDTRFGLKSTTDLSEGSNQYFTNARARGAISLTTTGTSGAATYNSSTGVINIPQYPGGSTVANVGSGYRVYKPGTQEIKTLFNGYAVGIDSSSNTNGLTLKADTSLISTIANRDKLRDSLNAAGWAKNISNSDLTANGSYSYNLSGYTQYIKAGKFKVDSVNTYPVSLPGIADSLMALGNSITAGQLASTTDSAYISRYKTSLGLVLEDRSVSGRGIWQAATNANTNFNPGASKMTTLMAGFNDVRRTDTTNVNTYRKTQNKVINGTKNIIQNQFLSRYFAAGSASVTRAGSWSTGYLSNTVSGKTTNGAFTNTNNDSLYYTFTDSTIAIGFIYGDGSAEVMTTSVQIYIDGALQATLNLNNGSDGISDGSNSNDRIAGAWFANNLGYTSHRLSIINRTSSRLAIDYVGHFRSRSDMYPVVVFHAPRMDATGYATSPAGASNTVIDLINSRIDSLVATLPSWWPVYVARTNNYYDVSTGLSSSDHIHPNDVGHRQIWQAGLAALSDVNFLPSHGTLLSQENGSLYYIDSAKHARRVAFLDQVGVVAAPLTLTGTSNTQQLIVKGNGTQTANIMEIQNSGGSTLMNVDNGGGIQIRGGLNNPGGTGSLELEQPSANTGYVSIYNRNSSTWGTLNIRSATLNFVQNGTTKANFNSSGQLYVGASTSATSTLQVGGSFSKKYNSTATGITLDGTYDVVEVTATGQTITLPTAASITGRVYTIKLTASGSCTVATTSSQTIDGSTTYSLASQYKYVTVQSNGSNWIVIANN